MNIHIKKHIRSTRLNGLPETMRQDIKAARLKRGWSQQELGEQVGLPQMHISGIETGKIVPRYDTLLDLVRTLNYDLLMVPRSLIPVIQSIIRQHSVGSEEHSLYADDEASDGQESPHDEI